jgi:hypothetical protein
MTILLTGTRAPATLDLARRLWREGARVIGADSMRHPLGRFSRAFAAHHRVPSPRWNRRDFAYTLLRIVEREQVDLLWPTCEEIFHISALHAEISAQVRLLCDPLAVLEPLHHKLKFARLAGSHAPDSWDPADTPSDRRLVWKPNYSRFAVRTRVDGPPASTDGWMAQEFVVGEEFSSWALCVGGEIRTATFYTCPARAGRGAGCAFKPFWDDSAASFVKEIARDLQFTGSLAFDFIRSASGQLRVIECNPRLTSGLHVLAESVRLTDLLEKPGPMPPLMRPAHLRIPTLLSDPSVSRDSPDVVSAPDDRRPAWGQVLGMAELAVIAMSHRVSLTAAATLDIEYNGD